MYSLMRFKQETTKEILMRLWIRKMLMRRARQTPSLLFPVLRPGKTQEQPGVLCTEVQEPGRRDCWVHFVTGLLLPVLRPREMQQQPGALCTEAQEPGRRDCWAHFVTGLLFQFCGPRVDESLAAVMCRMRWQEWNEHCVIQEHWSCFKLELELFSNTLDP